MATIIKKGIDFICQLFGMEKKEKINMLANRINKHKPYKHNRFTLESQMAHQVQSHLQVAKV